MNDVLIGIGSNLGDRQANLHWACADLEKLPRTSLVAVSQIVETAAVGPIMQDDFLNAAARITTELSPRELLEALRMIEEKAGREPIDRRVRWGPRTLDLDIELFGSILLDSPTLQIPHPHMHERWFVLKPLADIAPDFVHPKFNKTIAQLLSELPPR